MQNIADDKERVWSLGPTKSIEDLLHPQAKISFDSPSKYTITTKVSSHRSTRGREPDGFGFMPAVADPGAAALQSLATTWLYEIIMS